MPLRLRRRPHALEDALDIWIRIAVDNIVAADAVAERLDMAVKRLVDFPELGPERAMLGAGVRMFPVDNIVIFYRVTANELEILRILHAAREITPDLLSD